MKKLKHRPLLLSACLAALVAVAFLAGTAFAQDSGETGQGWTIWQGGEKTSYNFKDQWRGEPTASGYQLRNAKSGVEHYYYGTFRVEHRPR